MNQPQTKINTYDFNIIKFTIDFMGHAEAIREKLELFDRDLADMIKPLAIIVDGFDLDGDGTTKISNEPDYNFNFVYDKVIDRISQLNFNKFDDSKLDAKDPKNKDKKDQYK